ncbi:MAG TPA: DUF58 domain-containing protein [Microscillaceae bacterium]|jgi:uncharacterized protein (DUF58 family)|nr:DUF58 domain-containing protein [Microscillaceae bacterium]
MAKKQLIFQDLAQIREFGNIEFLAKQLVEGFITGLHRSPFHGFSVEFAEHRLYNTGESTRHIDWKVFAKTDKLFVKRYEEETNLRAVLLLDISSSMYYPVENYGKLTFSIMAASAIAYMLQKQKDAVGLVTFADSIIQQTAVKSTSSHTHKLFLTLDQLLHSQAQAQGTNIAPIIHEIAEKIHKRSLVIIFSDMFDRAESQEELFSALNHLKYNQHEVLLFHVNDKKTELDFDFKERPTEFVDLETGQKVQVQPGQIKDVYRSYVEQFYKALKLKCGQYKIDFIEADIRSTFDQILYTYLVKRSKM